WRLGSLAFALDGAALPAWAAASPDVDDARVWLAAWDASGQLLPDALVGYVFDEAFREEARPALRRLSELGCEAALLSGDHQNRVDAAASHLSEGGRVRV